MNRTLLTSRKTGLLLAIAALTAAPAVAQMPPEPPPITTPAATPTAYPPCKAPAAGEYLLLVVSPTAESQEKARRIVPSSLPSTLCGYLNETVTRVGGFSTIDSANAWAKYVKESAGLTAFVARASETTPQAAFLTPTVPTAPPAASGSDRPQTAAAKPGNRAASAAKEFNPQVLGSGYAVLVDFHSQPELAAQLQQATGKPVGLASYRQRPYLIAIYTADNAQASSALQALSERGFWAMLVDSRQVTLLKQSVDVAALNR